MSARFTIVGTHVTGMWAVAIGESSAFIRTRADHGCNAWTPREGGSR